MGTGPSGRAGQQGQCQLAQPARSIERAAGELRFGPWETSMKFRQRLLQSKPGPHMRRLLMKRPMAWGLAQ